MYSFTRKTHIKNYYLNRTSKTVNLKVIIRYDQITRNIFMHFSAKTITVTWTWRPYASWATGNRSVYMQALHSPAMKTAAHAFVAGSRLQKVNRWQKGRGRRNRKRTILLQIMFHKITLLSPYRHMYIS